MVLSCGDSGRGRVLKGEGVVGIACAFLAAGGRSVLVGLWAIEDETCLLLAESRHSERLQLSHTLSLPLDLEVFRICR